MTPELSRRRKRLRNVFIGLVIYSLIGFVLLPLVIRWQLRRQLPVLTHRQAQVQQVRVNPFALSLTVRGLALTETNGAAFVAFDEFYANFELSSIFHRAWTFSEIHLLHPTANLVRLAGGDFNFSNLAGTNAAPATNPPAPPPALLIQSLLVSNAIVTFTDQTTPQAFQAVYGPINVALTDFNTHREKEEPYSFVATTADGESFAWSGIFSLQQLRSRGQFKLAGIPPRKYGPYLAQYSTVQIERGIVEVGASYRVNVARQPPELEITNATVAVRDLVMKPPADEKTLLALEHFNISDATASLTGHVARVGLIAINGGSVFLQREPDGQPTLLQYLVQRTNETATGASTAPIPAAPWQFKLEELAITNFNVALEDHSAAGVAALGLDALALNLTGLSNLTNAPIALQLAFDWHGGGSARVETHGTLQPLDLNTHLALSNLAIPPVQPYLGQHLNLVVNSGGLNLDGTLHFNPNVPPLLHFTGDLGITNFASSETVAYHELATWENHQARGIDFTLAPNQLTIQEVKFVGARNNLVVSSNGVLNVAALAKLPAHTNAVAPPASTNAAPAELFPIRVVLLTLEQNSFHLADDSLPRHLATHVEEINGTVQNIVIPGLERAQVDLRGKVSALAPFEITGAVTPDPQNLFVDLKVAFTNTDLTALSPYTEKYVGRPLTKGKLTTELLYHIENRTLAASNFVDLAQLTLGAKVESPSATKLPVKLAIGLLKDIDGHIKLDLPLAGSLDDPQFSIWGLVGQTLKNLIVKIATSPFSLLGALAGGGAELQFVDFDPGQSQLNDSQTNKLYQLAVALQKRPALGLEVGASLDPDRDTDALGRQKVADRMKALRIEELVARGKPAPTLSELQLDDGEYERLLRGAYRAAFNTTPEQALYEKLSATAGTNGGGQTSENVPAASGDSAKGASRLMTFKKSLTQLAAAASSPATSKAGAEAKPKSEKELVRDELELRLGTLAPVTSDELRALMQQRIDVVQKFLGGPAGISADRILPTNPDPADPNRQGQPRVVFSLE